MQSIIHFNNQKFCLRSFPLVISISKYSSRNYVRDPYIVLGVPKSATKDQIRKAYLGLCIKYHPDKHEKDNPEFYEKYVEVQGAYAILGKEETRKVFDTSVAKRKDGKVSAQDMQMMNQFQKKPPTHKFKKHRHYKLAAERYAYYKTQQIGAKPDPPPHPPPPSSDQYVGQHNQSVAMATGMIFSIIVIIVLRNS